ncbi:MAG: PadR family transcriptional regulator [Thermoanaerobaculia bacterium]
MAKKRSAGDQAQKLTLELRRGTLVLAALSQLKTPKYGYSLLQDLAKRGLEVEQGTLYPLLRRLDEQGLLESTWNVAGPRPRKYYQLSAEGLDALAALAEQWSDLVAALEQLIAERDTQGESDGSD